MAELITAHGHKSFQPQAFQFGMMDLDTGQLLISDKPQSEQQITTSRGSTPFN
jgi:hypothetical protein